MVLEKAFGRKKKKKKGKSTLNLLLSQFVADSYKSEALV